MKTKRFVSTLLALLLVCSLPISAFADTVADNPAGTTVPEIPAGDMMYSNSGTVTNNDGAVNYNHGILTNNNNFVRENYGTVTNNYGEVNENYGTVTLVLKVKMIADKSRIGLGGVGDFPNSDLRSVTMFVDQDGESYTPDGGTTSDSFDVSEGVYVKLKIDGTYTRFENVKKTAKVMQVLKLGLYVDAAIRGYITMKNVPIQWDVEP